MHTRLFIGMILAVAAMLSPLAGSTLHAQQGTLSSDSASKNEPGESDQDFSSAIGMPGKLTQMVIQGPELQVKPIEDRNQQFLVRIVDIYPHGDDFRYDLEYIGLEPGNYNVLEYLEPVSPDETWERSELRVSITSMLPAGQIKPTDLSIGQSHFGNYYTAILVGGGLLWVVGLFTILFWGRMSTFWPQDAERPRTLAETLRPLLEKAREGVLTSTEKAGLERMLVAYWQRKLKLQHLDAATVRQRLREHQEAGQVLNQIDRWLHAPEPDRDLDLNEFLRPYQQVAEEGELV